MSHSFGPSTASTAGSSEPLIAARLSASVPVVLRGLPAIIVKRTPAAPSSRMRGNSHVHPAHAPSRTWRTPRSSRALLTAAKLLYGVLTCDRWMLTPTGSRSAPAGAAGWGASTGSAAAAGRGATTATVRRAKVAAAAIWERRAERTLRQSAGAPPSATYGSVRGQTASRCSGNRVVARARAPVRHDDTEHLAAHLRHLPAQAPRVGGRRAADERRDQHAVDVGEQRQRVGD